jgi:hypothetical protein
MLFGKKGRAGTADFAINFPDIVYRTDNDEINNLPHKIIMRHNSGRAFIQWPSR